MVEYITALASARIGVEWILWSLFTRSTAGRRRPDCPGQVRERISVRLQSRNLTSSFFFGFILDYTTAQTRSSSEYKGPSSIISKGGKLAELGVKLRDEDHGKSSFKSPNYNTSRAL